MTTISELDMLEIEYHVFQRLLNHCQELEKEPLSTVLNTILKEIYLEEYDLPLT